MSTAGSIYAGSLGFASGVALQTFLPVSLFGLHVLAGLALLAAVVSRVVSARSLWATGTWWASVALLAAVLGVWRMDVAQEARQAPQLDAQAYQTTTLTGTVSSEPELRRKSQHLAVETPDGGVLVVADRHEAVRYGDLVRVTGRLQTPEPFASELGRTFPYDGYLAAQGLTHTMFYPELTVVERGGGNPVVAALLTAKAAFITKLEQHIAEPAVGLGEGLLLGVRRAMPDSALTDFRTTGIIHIVVLSGFNVMLVVSFVRYVLGFALPLRPRLLVALVAIAAFAITVGLTATVVRASIMASLLVVAQFLGRTYEAFRGLFVAGTIMVALNPYLLVYDIGFQLSFVATLGLILVAPHLETKLNTVPATIGVRSFLVATVATQIAVLPLLLYHVGEFSVVAPLVNMLVLPAVAAAMLLTFATGLLAFVLPVAVTPVALAAYLTLQYILVVAEWFAAVPLASFWVPAFPFYMVPIGYALLGGLYWWYAHRPIRASQPPAFAAVPADTELADWTIIDVSDGVPDSELAKLARTQSAAASQRDAAADTTPIFFR